MCVLMRGLDIRYICTRMCLHNKSMTIVSTPVYCILSPESMAVCNPDNGPLTGVALYRALVLGGSAELRSS